MRKANQPLLGLSFGEAGMEDQARGRQSRTEDLSTRQRGAPGAIAGMSKKCIIRVEKGHLQDQALFFPGAGT